MDPAAAAGALPRDTQIDHFRVLRLIGRGGMGEVYLARDGKLGRKVALKLINPDQLGSDESRERFVFEARATARFNHPNIVTIYGTGEYHGRPYVALEYVPGQDLRQRLRDGGVSVREAMRVALDIARALAEAHGHGLLHRDLKPGNVLIGKDGQVRVVDFGLAKAIDRSAWEAPDASVDHFAAVDGVLATPPTPAARNARQEPNQDDDEAPGEGDDGGWDDLDAELAAIEAELEAEEGPDELLDGPDTSPEDSAAGRLAVAPTASAHVPPGSPPNPKALTVDEPYSSSHQGLIGSPPYMSPEQWRGEKMSGASDIWAFGVVLHEMLTGRRPYTSTSPTRLAELIASPKPVPALGDFAELPPELARLVNACLAKEADKRPTPANLCVTLERLIAGRPGSTDDDSCPFPGLLPFDEHQAPLFFGRTAETQDAVERLRRAPMLAVVGRSGAGKSSFVYAGVLPRLREQRPSVLLSLRPGKTPFRTLAARLIALRENSTRSMGTSSTVDVVGSVPRPSADDALPGDPEALAARLFDQPALLGLELRRLASLAQAQVLVVIDQLEELFALVEDEERRRRFIAAIAAAADEPDDPVRAVLTLRDDFLVQLADSAPEQAPLRNLMVLRTPDWESLRGTLTRPVESARYRFEDDELADEMVDDVISEAAALPLLQFAARTLWEHRDRHERVLTRKAYEESGGVAGALVSHADGVLQGLSSAEQRVVRELLLRLITPAGTRQILPQRRLLSGLDKDANAVLDRLISARLLTARQTIGEEDAEIELVHESLIANWGTLAHWVDESRLTLNILAELEEAAALWERRGKPADEVWRGAALAEAERNVERDRLRVSDGVRAFVEAGRRRTSRNQRRRGIAIAVAGAVLLGGAVASLVVAGALATKEQRARKQRVLAERRGALALREAAAAARKRGDLLESRAKLRQSLEVEDSTVSRMLWWMMRHDPRVWSRRLPASAHDVALSPDGRLAAAACQNRTVYLLDTTTGQQRALRGHRDQVLAVAFSPDGRTLAAGTRNSEIWLWNWKQGRKLVLRGHGGPVRRLVFGPQGRRLASASWDGSVRLWTLRGDAAAFERTLGRHQDRVYGLAFSPDGRWVASGSYDRTVRLWSVDDERQHRLLGRHKDRVLSVAFSPDGALLASGGSGARLRLWRVASGKAHAVLRESGEGINRLAFSLDGHCLAAASADKTVRIWEMPTLKLRRVLADHSAGVSSLSFGPNRVLATSSYDKTVRLWRLGDEVTGRRGEPTPGIRRRGHRDRVNGVAFAPNGKLLASASSDRSVRLWDTTTGKELGRLMGHEDGVMRVAFSPRGRQLASAGWDNAIRIFDVASSTQRQVLLGHGGEIHDLAYDKEGERLYSASWDRSVWRWDVASGGGQRFAAHTAGVRGVALSPQGETLASAGGDRLLRLWSLPAGKPLQQLGGHQGTVTSLAFSPDGRQVASGSYDRSVRLWELASGVSRVLGRHQGRVYRVAYHPSMPLLASAGADGLWHLWATKTKTGGKPLRSFRGHRDTINDLAFSPDGALAATASDDGSVRLWSVEEGRPQWRLRLRVHGERPRVRTHLGWAFGAPPEGEVLLAAGIREALHLPPRGERAPRICARGDGELSFWSLEGRASKRVYREALPHLQRIAGFGDRCLSLAGGVLRLHDGKSPGKVLRRKVRHIHSGAELLVIQERRVEILRQGGVERSSIEVPAGVTAAARLRDGSLLVGLEDGRLLRVGAGVGARGFGETDASAVRRIVEGPRGLLIVGYASGVIGFWSSRGGGRLQHARLHGAIEVLKLSGRRLYAASDLGDTWVGDLSVFSMAYCELLRQLWQAVPVVWDRGLASRAPLPLGHRCAAAQQNDE